MASVYLKISLKMKLVHRTTYIIWWITVFTKKGKRTPGIVSKNVWHNYFTFRHIWRMRTRDGISCLNMPGWSTLISSSRYKTPAKLRKDVQLNWSSINIVFIYIALHNWSIEQNVLHLINYCFHCKTFKGACNETLARLRHTCHQDCKFSYAKKSKFTIFDGPLLA